MIGAPEKVTGQCIRTPMTVEELVLALLNQDQVRAMAQGYASCRRIIVLSERVDDHVTGVVSRMGSARADGCFVTCA